MDADDCTTAEDQTTHDLEENNSKSPVSIFNAHLDTVNFNLIEPFQNQNIKALFALILNKPEPVTIEDFFILDNFGTELAR